VKARIRRYLPAAIGLAIVVGTFAFVLPRIANYGDVWRVIRDLSWQQVMLLVGATALNLATYAPPWQAALPGLGFTRAFFMTQASTASTYIAPGGAAVGIALSYAMLRRWGFRGSDVALAVAVTGVWNQFVLLGFPVIALALLTLTGERNALLQTVAVIALIIFVIAAGAFTAGLSFRGIAHWLGDLAARVVSWGLRLIRRGPVKWTGESLVAFRNEAVALLGRRWHVITLATLAGQLTVFLLFLVCLRVLDVSAGEVSLIEAFAAWSLVRLLGSLPITPGGIGIVEVGLTSALVGFGGQNAEVVAAVLVYRTLTMVPTLVLGLVTAAVWRRLEKPSQPVAAA
jgi:putative heme transporter